MEKEFSYYVIEPIITERTALLMCNGGIDPDGIDFIYEEEPADEGHVAHLQFLMPNKNPDMEVDYLFLETYAVFSGRVRDALQQHMPIKNLQLVEAVINENDEEYTDFWISHIYRVIQSFDEKLSTYDEIDSDDGHWYGTEKIVLNKERLSQIPLDERLVFIAQEDTAFKLYHESIVDIIQSVNPKGMRFVPVEEWSHLMTF